MNREVHVRFWESPEVKVLRATRQPDIHDEQTNNLFLQTRGLPRPATDEQAHYILERLADLSRPFGTTIEVNGDTAEIKLKVGN